MDVVGFHWLDYVIFVGLLAVSLVIGLLSGLTGNRQRTTQEVLTANRKLKPVPVAVSIFITYISGILFLGYVAEMYLHGTQMFMSCLGGVTGYFLSARLFVPLLYPLKLTSTFQYHAMRYKFKVLNIFCSATFMLSWVIYLGMAIYAPAVALEAVTGFSLNTVVFLIGGVATVYTALGGLKAVVWTDLFQASFLLGGAVLLVALGAHHVGGLGRVWSIAQEHGRINFLRLDWSPFVRMSLLTAFLGLMVNSLGEVGALQGTVQRYSSVPTLSQAKLCVYLQIPLVLSMFTVAMLLGLVVFAYFQQLGCDPYRSGKISSPNQLLPYFIATVLNYPGVLGLFTAVLCSGSLSTVSSGLSSLAAIVWKDYLESFVRFSEFGKAIVIKCIIVVFGVIGTTMGLLMRHLSGHIGELSLSIMGSLYGPLAGVVVLGALFPCAQGRGALVGAVCGIALSTWLVVGQTLYTPYRSYLNTTVANCTLDGNSTIREIPQDSSDVFVVYRLSFLLFGGVTLVVTVLVGLLASLVTGKQKKDDVDPRLLINLPQALCCCISGSGRTEPYDLKAAEATEENSML